ncbi:MAG TPA: M50 family metallopeptidase, partial [Fimbriimonas sp.]|nr:M50 family metallopeptidase [Fimbriimonas sp.]
ASRTNSMEPHELLDICYHEAAHAVVAIAVGAQVNYVEIGKRPYKDMTSGGGCSWGSTHDLPWEEIYAIFAAGYVSDLLRGAPKKRAHAQSEGDRLDMRASLEERSGIFLSEKGREIRFTQGVERASHILAKQDVETAWRRLAEELAAKVRAGSNRMLHIEVMKVVQPHLSKRAG